MKTKNTCRKAEEAMTRIEGVDMTAQSQTIVRFHHVFLSRYITADCTSRCDKDEQNLPTTDLWHFVDSTRIPLVDLLSSPTLYLEAVFDAVNSSSLRWISFSTSQKPLPIHIDAFVWHGKVGAYCSNCLLRHFAILFCGFISEQTCSILIQAGQFHEVSAIAAHKWRGTMATGQWWVRCWELCPEEVSPSQIVFGSLFYNSKKTGHLCAALSRSSQFQPHCWLQSSQAADLIVNVIMIHTCLQDMCMNVFLLQHFAFLRCDTFTRQLILVSRILPLIQIYCHLPLFCASWFSC